MKEKATEGTMNRYAIGLDVGTTHVKACMVRADGTVSAIAETDNEKKETMHFGSCFLPEELFEKALYCIRRVIEETGCEPEAIGITSMAEAGVFLDVKGDVLVPVIPWSDVGAECLLPEDLCGKNLYQRTGLIWHPKYSVNRILMLKKEHADLYKRIGGFLSVSDYILYRLTGAKCTDESLACRTGMYDIVNRCWWKKMTDFVGMTGKLPEVVREEAGWPLLGEEARILFGISGNVQVRVCGHDHLCAANAENLRDGEVFNSMGTSEIYAGWLENPCLTEVFYERGILQGRFGGRCYWISNMPSSGASVEWFRNLISVQEKISYEVLMEQEGQVPSPVLYLPFVNGGGTHRTAQEMTAEGGSGILPRVNGNAVWNGGFLGITSETGRGDILQSIYEGIAMESCLILSQLAQTGQKTTFILTVGGGCRNQKLMQAKADVTGSTYSCSSNVQASAVGAALLAGGFQQPERRVAKVIRPREEYTEAYRKKYELYRRLL